MENLDKISSLEIVDSALEQIDKLREKDNIKTFKIVHYNVKDLETYLH